MRNDFLDEEEYFNKKNKKYCKNKNIITQMTTDESKSYAEILKQTNVDNINVFGFMTDNNISYKYCKSKDFYVKYNNDVISYGYKSFRDYQSDKAIYYYDEL